jgi:predicted RNase H-like HicB family nuclease
MMKNIIEEDLRMAHILYKYIEKAMSEVVYEKIDDNEYAGRIPSCSGVIAFAATLEECKQELLSVLEDWILLGLRYGHPLPVVGGIDPNREISIRMETVNDQMATV